VAKPGHPPPSAAGIYSLIKPGKKKKKEKVGITGDLNTRAKQHGRDPRHKGLRFEYKQTTQYGPEAWKRLQELERAKIKKHKPRLNKHPGGNGRPPKI
jgi:hypothetical protein